MELVIKLKLHQAKELWKELKRLDLDPNKNLRLYWLLDDLEDFYKHGS